MLGVLAGAFIGLGALMFTLVASDADLGFAATRLLGGLGFSLGVGAGDGRRRGAFHRQQPARHGLAMLPGAPLGAMDMARNLVPVIAGNRVGGSVLVALVYYVIYVRTEREKAPARSGEPDGEPDNVLP